MKKRLTAIFLASLMLLISFANLTLPAMAADAESFYSQIELETVATSGMTKIDFEGASGGKIAYGTATDNTNRLDFTVTVPQAGDYAVWVRAYVHDNYQSQLGYTTNCSIESVKGKVFAMVSSNGFTGGYIWYPIRVAEASSATTYISEKVLPFAEGANRFQLQVKKLGTATQQSHYFDCAIVTNNMNFDPNYHWSAEKGVQFTDYVGAQDRVNEADSAKKDVRFLAAMDDYTKYESVGFEFVSNGKTYVADCKYVYRAVMVGSTKAYPASYSGSYFYCFTITGMAVGEYTFAVTPISRMIGGETVRGETTTVTVTVPASGNVSYTYA